MESSLIYRFDDDHNLSKVEPVMRKKINNNLTLLNSVLINPEYSYSGYDCKKSQLKYRITNYLNEKGSSEIIITKAYSDVEIINKYLPDKKFRTQLMWISSDFLNKKMYTLETVETTHCSYPEDQNNQILISRVLYIQEKDSINAELKFFLDKINP